MKYDLVLKLMKFIYSYSIVFVLLQLKLKLLKPHILKPILKCVAVVIDRFHSRDQNLSNRRYAAILVDQNVNKLSARS